MIPLAQIPADGAFNWNVVLAIGILLSTGMSFINFIRTVGGGKENERQIQPTSLAAIQSELKGQTQVLAKLDREMGETRAEVKAVKEQISLVQRIQREDTDKVFQRINAISRECEQNTTRLDSIERMCPKC